MLQTFPWGIRSQKLPLALWGSTCIQAGTAVGQHVLQDSCLLLKHLVLFAEYWGCESCSAQKQTSTLAMHSTRQDEVPWRVCKSWGGCAWFLTRNSTLDVRINLSTPVHPHKDLVSIPWCHSIFHPKGGRSMSWGCSSAGWPHFTHCLMQRCLYEIKVKWSKVQ